MRREPEAVVRHQPSCTFLREVRRAHPGTSVQDILECTMLGPVYEQQQIREALPLPVRILSVRLVRRAHTEEVHAS